MSRSKNPLPQHFEGVIYPDNPYGSMMCDFFYDHGWYRMRNIKNGSYMASKRWYTIQYWINTGMLQIVSCDGVNDLNNEIDLSDVI